MAVAREQLARPQHLRILEPPPPLETEDDGLLYFPHPSVLSPVEELEEQLAGVNLLLREDQVYRRTEFFIWGYKTRGGTKKDPNPRYRRNPVCVIKIGDKLITYEEGSGKGGLDVVAQHFYPDDNDAENRLENHLKRGLSLKRQRKVFMMELEKRREVNPPATEAVILDTDTELPW